jgi:membrane carboxypeptidase/penicillin-binding protein
LESEFPKQEIANKYLQLAYFGWRMNGIDEACLRLGVDLRAATAAEAAGILARLKYPEPFNPSPKRLIAISTRGKYVFSAMRRAEEESQPTAKVVVENTAIIAET